VFGNVQVTSCIFAQRKVSIFCEIRTVRINISVWIQVMVVELNILTVLKL